VHTYYVHMNLTLSVDRRIVERARRATESMGVSLNQAIRDYLAQLAGTDSAEADSAEFARLSARPKGRRRGWTFDRDDLHARP
jgi:hypothetical protein